MTIVIYFRQFYIEIKQLIIPILVIYAMQFWQCHSIRSISEQVGPVRVNLDMHERSLLSKTNLFR